MRLPEAVASGRLAAGAGQLRALAELAREADFAPVDGILLDLGLSSDQLADRGRGFSFVADAPLDMRFDPTRGQSAADLVNTLDETELADLIYRYGEERRSRAIARRIVAPRSRAPIKRSGELARLVESACTGAPAASIPLRGRFRRCASPSTTSLAAWRPRYPPRWRRCVPVGASPSSAFTRWKIASSSTSSRLRRRGCVCPPELPACVCGRSPRLRILTRHPLVPSEDEQATNPRARSAKLRVAERLDA